MNYFAAPKDPSSASKRDGRRSRHTKSFRSQQINTDGPTEISPQSNKNGNSSVRASHGISYGLVSLVTKFEALDALSLPITETSLQPAPLQTPRSLTRHRHNPGNNYRKRLSAVFSRQKGIIDGNDDDVFESDSKPARAGILGLSPRRPNGSWSSKTDKRVPKETKAPDKPSSMRLCRGIWVGTRETSHLLLPFSQLS